MKRNIFGQLTVVSRDRRGARTVRSENERLMFAI